MWRNFKFITELMSSTKTCSYLTFKRCYNIYSTQYFYSVSSLKLTKLAAGVYEVKAKVLDSNTTFVYLEDDVFILNFLCTCTTWSP